MLKYISLALLLSILSPLHAEDVDVAVAANFTTAARAISRAFEKETGHRVRLSSGSTGKFFTQIQSGAPFDVLLSADQETPEKLVKEGLAVRDSTFTYAVGRLVLWSATPGFVDEKGAVLKSDRYQHLAIANPKLAPYGKAAEQVLKRLGLLEVVRPRFLQAENITQAHQFVSGGHAELGFVALSQVVHPDGTIASGSAWIIPVDYYSPLKQDCLLLNRGKDRAAAIAFLRYLKSDAAKAVIRSYGYTY